MSARAAIDEAGAPRAAGAWAAVLRRCIAPAAVLAGWSIVSLFYPPDLVPSPIQLARIVWQIVSDGASWAIIGTTLARILFGLAFSMLLGVPLGLFMGAGRYSESLLKGWIVVLLGMPAVAWAFLGVLWFGVGDAAPVFTIVLVVLPVVTMNIWQGVKSTNKDLHQMAKAFRASNGLIFLNILVPHLMPYLYSALKIGFALGWKIALIGEVFGVTIGVGREFMYWFQNFRLDMMLGWALTFMTLMAAVEIAAFRRLDKAVYGWRNQVTTRSLVG